MEKSNEKTVGISAATDKTDPENTSSISTLSRRTAHYPQWGKEFERKYLTKTLDQFILHGNVRDLVPTLDEKEETAYIPLRDFLSDDLFGARDAIIFYDRASGIHFVDNASTHDFYQAVTGYDTIFGTDYAKKFPKDPVRVFALLDNYFRVRLGKKKRIACIIDYAETVIPMAEASMYSSEDRNTAVFLQRWAHDPLFLRTDFTICLIAENLNDLNQQLVQSPWTAEIQIPMPDEKARKKFVYWFTHKKKTAFDQHASITRETLAKNTAGLSFIQLRTILADTIENKIRLTYEQLSEMKKEMIEEAAFGMLEFIETDYRLDMVAGHAEAKEHLQQVTQALRNNHSEVLPMGYLVSGPVGTGKTFLIMCFAGEIGIPMVKLKNFRSQWQGQTEGNLEKILHLLEAMPPVAVMIDEADAALGNRDAQGDSGVSKRVFGQIATFMSNPKHRGNIIFFLVTARPDLMPIDLKRQGRAEEHIALFYPSTRAARKELLRIMMHRTNVTLPMEDVPDVLLNGERAYSGADMEALMTRAKFRAAAETSDAHVTKEILAHVVEDFIPPTYPLEIELQVLVAVLECTSRDLLPEKYRDLDRKKIVERVRELKMLAP